MSAIPVHEERPTNGMQRMCICGFKTSAFGNPNTEFDAHLFAFEVMS